MVEPSAKMSRMSRAHTLDGMWALVTGASAGIGRAAALELASMGANIIVLARRAKELAAVADELRARGAPAALTLPIDLEDLAALGAALDRVLAGDRVVQILVNSSGGPPSGAIIDAAAADFERAFRRHLLAPHLLVQRLVPGMTSAGYGRIINVVSTSVKEPIVGLGVSNTIRGAVAGWAKTLSKELPPGITINNVLPGFTATERLTTLADALAARSGQTPDEIRAGWLATVPEGRLAEPAELAAVIAFLASPAAAFVRGVSLPVDGGRSGSI